MKARHSSGREVPVRENLRRLGSHMRHAPYYRVKFYGLVAGMVLLVVVLVLDV